MKDKKKLPETYLDVVITLLNLLVLLAFMASIVPDLFI